MKKVTKFVIISTLLSIILIASLLTGCQNLSGDEGYDALQKAIETTLNDDNAHIYYYKESYATPVPNRVTNLVETTTVNVLCSIDKDYNFEKNSNAEYDYKDLKVRVTKNYDGKSVYELFCGRAEDGSNKLAIRGDLNRRDALTDDDDYTLTEATAKDFILNSGEFTPYTLETKLAELKSLKREDLLIEEYENGGVEKKGNVTTITCKMSDAYCNKYYEQNGKDSVLKGKYLTIEMAYERISAITVYQHDPKAGESNTSGILALEYESYKLEIVYTGPKFTVPHKN